MKTYPRLHRLVHYSPWLVLPTAHAAVSDVLAAASRRMEVADLEEAFADLIPTPRKTEISGGLAVIPVVGYIGKNVANIEKVCGAVDLDDLSAELDAVAANPEVKRVLLDIDSPGGTVTGVPEIGAKIRELNETKKVVAWSESMAASAAYWIASQAGRVYGSPSSEWGSIGVYQPWVDITEALAAQGKKVDLIKAGDLKGAGYPGVPLSEDQRAHLQHQVDTIKGMFDAAVVAARPGVAADSMRGQTFLAAESQKRKLIDGIYSSKASLISRLRN